MIESFAAQCRRELDRSVIPFWLRHSLDRKHGGYFTALERDGTVYDSRKYMWLQGREVWMFARLYNEWAKKDEYLDAAAVGAEFIRRRGRDREGRVLLALTREGRPAAYQRKPYGAVFVMMGLLEYGKAIGDPAWIREALDLFWKIVGWIRNPALVGRLPVSRSARPSQLADEMVLMGMAMEILRVREDRRVRAVLNAAVRNAMLHYDTDRRVLLELAAPDGRDLRGSPEGRLFNPGHSIEVAWFLLHALEFLADARWRRRVRKTALDVIEGSLEMGWDRPHGGLLYLMDIEGRPVLQLEHFMKLWWPHTEALYALVRAHAETGDRRWLKWLKKVRDYTWGIFPDPKFGEWFGYADRQGRLTHSCKGGNYKGCFHVPRFLMMTARCAERT